MTDVLVDTDGMRRTAKQARDKVAAVQRLTDELKRCVDELSATWTGGNHDEFVEDFDRAYEQMRVLDQSVERYMGGFEAAAQQYDACGEELANLARQVRV